MQTIYKMNVRGQIDEWSITAKGATIFTDYHGNVTEEQVTPKGGRSLAQQIESQIQSKIRSKLDHGYKLTREEAKEGISNQLWQPLPMLASAGTLETDSLWVQPKLDGMRMIATLDNTGEPLAYTRNGKSIKTVPHILDELKGSLEYGKYLDGELYAHGYSLQTIMSLAKRAQPHTTFLKYHAFDMIANTTFSKRTALLRDRITGLENTVYVQTQRVVGGPEVVTDFFNKARAQGYEGLILRDGHATYEAGKRVRHMVKVKAFFDEEYMCVDVTQGARGQAVLVLHTTTGQPFRATAPGDSMEKALALENPEDFVGHWVTVKHAGLTPYGIPFHPVAVAVRA